MNRVKEFRKELGISQLELAKGYRCLGDRPSIWIENDKYNPTPGTLSQLARSLQTGPHQSLWEEDFKKEQNL